MRCWISAASSRALRRAAASAGEASSRTSPAGSMQRAISRSSARSSGRPAARSARRGAVLRAPAESVPGEARARASVAPSSKSSRGSSAPPLRARASAAATSATPSSGGASPARSSARASPVSARRSQHARARRLEERGAVRAPGARARAGCAAAAASRARSADHSRRSSVFCATRNGTRDRLDQRPPESPGVESGRSGGPESRNGHGRCRSDRPPKPCSRRHATSTAGARSESCARSTTRTAARTPRWARRCRAIVEAAEVLAVVLGGRRAAGSTSARARAAGSACSTPRRSRRPSASPPDRVQALIAGGERALLRAVEGAEDHPERAIFELRERGLSAGDAVVAISASGHHALRARRAWRSAHEVGARTIAITCDPRIRRWPRRRRSRSCCAWAPR